MLVSKRDDFLKNKRPDGTLKAKKYHVATPNKWALEF